MSRIRSRDTKPEVLARSSLHRAGFRFRVHPKGIRGSPDFVLPRYRVAVFVHGCFWHGHACRLNHAPKSNVDYWTEKIRRNIERDAVNLRLVEMEGWHPVAIYECELNQGVDSLVSKLQLLKGISS